MKVMAIAEVLALSRIFGLQICDVGVGYHILCICIIGTLLIWTFEIRTSP